MKKGLGKGDWARLSLTPDRVVAEVGEGTQLAGRRPGADCLKAQESCSQAARGTEAVAAGRAEGQEVERHGPAVTGCSEVDERGR